MGVVVNYGQAALDFFLAHYTDPCAVQATWPDLFAVAYADHETSQAGTVDTLDGVKATSFFDGVLKYNVPGIKDCLIDYSGNVWFGASACVRFSTFNNYSKDKGFDLMNEAGLGIGGTIFGIDFQIIDGDASAAWKQGDPAQTPSASVNDVITNSTLPNEKDERTYDGPGATFAIGPVPISITSRLTTMLSVGVPKTSLVKPPFDPGVAGQGHLNLGVGAEARFGVGFDADIDLLIAKAGVSGTLNLLDVTVGGNLNTTIDPLANQIVVDKNYGMDGTALSGELDAFVELDLLVYSKRWSVEIVSWDGLVEHFPVLDTQYTGFAVDPKSIHPASPKCP